jgi:hypothetical protein
MAPQTAADRAADKRKRREAKQKKMLLVLIPVLIAMVAWQGPKLMKQLKGSSAETAPAAATVESPANPGVDAAAAGTDETAPAEAPVPTDPAEIAAAVKELPASEKHPIPDENQLISFSRFSASDPFSPLVVEEDTSTTTDSGTSTTPSTTPPTTAPPTAYPPTTGGSTPTTPTQVALSVNGHPLVLGVGDTFPTVDPAFTIVTINPDSVVIGLTDGSFSDGQQSITVRKGEQVTLVSQPDGTRFTIRVVEIT